MSQTLFVILSLHLAHYQQLKQLLLQGLQDATTYFRNHHHQMLYAGVIFSNLPIVSGITEVAYKPNIIKAHLGCFGMKWKDWDASIGLTH